ncbi:MAG: hypothetical protein M3161_02900 [Actinomycetota bacterium]|nr:hypothetical protein [Actinomycetota bacterium]
MLRAICHSSDSGWVEVDDLTKLSELREVTGNLVWAEADVADLDQDEADLIADEFGLDPLAVEDALNTRQRPKVEHYPTHQFAVFHQLDEVDGQLEATQIACFLGPHYLLTIHAGATRTLEDAKERWRAEAEERALDHPAQLLHTLFDVVVDEYQVIADRLENQIEELEEIALARPDAPIARQLYSLKQQISRFRRYGVPAARIIEWNLDDEGDDSMPKETQRLFRDVHDHLVRMREQIQNVDELARAVIDLTQTEKASLLNEINKRLTAWAAIFAASTLIAGIYGMNFTLVPKDQTLFGFWFAVGLMVVCSVALFTYFKRRKWL